MKHTRKIVALALASTLSLGGLANTGYAAEDGINQETEGSTSQSTINGQSQSSSEVEPRYSYVGEWDKLTPVKGNNNLKTQTITVAANAIGAAVGFLVSGGNPIPTLLGSTLGYLYDKNVPFVYWTDYKEWRMVGGVLQTRHKIDFFSDKARTKLIKSTGTFIQSDYGGPKSAPEPSESGTVESQPAE